MKKLSLMLIAILALLLSGCSGKPNPYPKRPNYKIEKPKKIYSKPSKDNLKKMVPKLQGKPYVWAEEGPSKFDCSGLTYYMYGSMGVEIPRVSSQQARVGKRIRSDELKYGDLLFFDTNRRRPGRITHVGMYIGNGWFTHASTKKHKVMYDSLHKSSYYKKRLRVCRRYLPEERGFFFAKAKQVPQWTNKKTHLAQEVTKPKQTTLAEVSQTKDTTTQEHYIQVLSFNSNNIDKAKPILNKIKQQGLRYKTIPKNKSIKLVIGPFKNTFEAKKHLPLVRNNINKSAFPARFKS